VRARITVTGTNACLNFVELFIFDVNQRNVGASAAGATLSLGTTYGTNVAAYGGDMLADPVATISPGYFANSGCGVTTDYYQAIFPTAPGFPNGYPVPISNVYFVNRDDGNNGRITTFGGVVQLYGANGSIVNAKTIGSTASVTTLSFSSPSPAPTPNPTSPVQTDPNARYFSARYIRINATAGQCLHFKEIFVFDTTYTNVALGRPTTGSAQNGTRTTAMAVNGIIDFDNVLPNADMTCSAACDGSGWWQVDLGGLYNLTSIVIWNRFPYTSPTTTGATLGGRLTGAKLYVLNWNQDIINTTILSGSMVQTLTTRTLIPPTPSKTGSLTPSPSIGATPSVTASPSFTATATNTPLSPNPFQITVSTTSTNVLNFIELFAFTSTGQNVAASVLGATTSQTSTYSTQVSSYANDLFCDPWIAGANNWMAGGASGPSTWTLNFPPAPGYPQGYPQPISTGACFHSMRVALKAESVSLVLLVK